MNIGVIGGGAIGLLVSSYLSTFHDVTVYVYREAQKKLLKDKGVTRLKHSEKDAKIHVKAKLYTELKEEDIYFVCVKQYQIEQLVPLLKQIHQPIIFLQNGMGHLKYMKKLQADTYVGVVEHGAKRMDDTVVNHLGEGVIRIAAFNGNNVMLTEIISSLHRDEFPILVETDYEKILKNKLIVNAVINPLTAIFNVPNGKVVTNDYIQSLARSLCREAAEVLQLNEEDAWEKIVETANNTRDNTSSMRADILQRRKTEIEAISGYLLEQKNDLPYTTFVYNSVLALEKEGTVPDEH